MNHFVDSKPDALNLFVARIRQETRLLPMTSPRSAERVAMSKG